MRIARAILILLSMAGCDKAPPPAPPEPRKLIVLGTTYVAAQIAADVGGTGVKTEWLVEQGQSLEALERTPQVLERLQKADLIITNGTGEEWASAGFDDPQRSKAIIRVDLCESAKDKSARQLLLDPAVAKELAGIIAHRLAIQRPAKAAEFRQNAEQFSQSVDDLIREYTPKTVSIWGKQVLVLSKDYSALTKTLGLIEVQPVSNSPLRLNDDEMALLRKAIKGGSIAALLVEVSTPPLVQEDLSQKLGVRVIALDSLGTSAGVGRNTFVSILRYDLEQLARLLP